MMKNIIWVLLCLPLLTMGQQKGIKFETELSWSQLKEKAQREHKYIFVDCYATWCGPCHWMSANIFPQKDVGDYFNAHFVNASFQMDKTTKDNKSVQNQYNDVRVIESTYKVDAYPTYLFFSPEGEIVHRFSGSTKNGEELLQRAREALDPAKQYYTQKKNAIANILTQDTTALWKAYLSAREQNDEEFAKELAKAYLKQQSDFASKRSIVMITTCHLIRSSNDSLFKFFIDNINQIDSLHIYKGMQSYVAWSLEPIIFKENMESIQLAGQSLKWQSIISDINKTYPCLNQACFYDQLEEDFRNNIKESIGYLIADSKTTPDWASLNRSVAGKYPDYDFGRILLERKAIYYAKKQKWNDCAAAAYDLMHQYGNSLDEYHMNNVIWDWVFSYCSDRRILNEAAEWMKKKLAAEPGNPYATDTYANLLYKLGNKQLAIQWETIAIKLAQDQNLSKKDTNAFLANLEMIRNGHKTWKDNTQVHR